jgi:serine/threonine protein kinase
VRSCHTHAPGPVTRTHPATQAILGLPATTAWDVWSLGCALYEAATGTILFGGIEPAAAALSAARGDGGGGSSSGGGGAQWRGAAAAAEEEAAREAGERAADAVHLALIRGLLGPPPQALLARARHAQRGGRGDGSNGGGSAAALFDSRGEVAEVYADRRPLGRRLAEDGAFGGDAAVGWGFEGMAPLPTVAGAPPLCFAAAQAGATAPTHPHPFHALATPPNPLLQGAAAFESFLSPLLAFDPDARPTAAQALRHPWLAGGGGGSDGT